MLLNERAEFIWPETVNLAGYNPPGEAEPAQVAQAAALINQAERPVILAGHGILISHAWEELSQLAEKAQIPVVPTLLGISSFPSDHYLNLGMSGMHGWAHSNFAIDKADLLISLGMRFGRSHYRQIEGLRPQRKNSPR